LDHARTLVYYMWTLHNIFAVLIVTCTMGSKSGGRGTIRIIKQGKLFKYHNITEHLIFDIRVRHCGYYLFIYFIIIIIIFFFFCSVLWSYNNIVYTNEAIKSNSRSCVVLSSKSQRRSVFCSTFKPFRRELMRRNVKDLGNILITIGQVAEIEKDVRTMFTSSPNAQVYCTQKLLR
jgi:hypothetical protein